MEKAARAEERTADAEEVIARHLGDVLRSIDPKSKRHATPSAGKTEPPKPKHPRR